MVQIITSSPSVCMDGAINHANGFLDLLHKHLGRWNKGCFLSSHPDDPAFGNHCGIAMKKAFEDVNINFSKYVIIDRRTAHIAKDIISSSDFVILGGGHVPTQNKFINEIGMANMMKDFNGVVLGISAGSMNMADEVYACPEEPGESSHTYKRFLKGLGLTKHQILPHYYMEKDMKVDGLRLYEDIVFPDSFGHRFYVMPDGSYILSEGGCEYIYGEAFIIENGIFRKICENGQRFKLHSSTY